MALNRKREGALFDHSRHPPCDQRRLRRHLGIYAPYIDTSITFEEEIPTCEAFQARTDGVLAAHPYLVAEIDGKVVGYAYAHELRDRGAYRWNSELSVYLAPAAQGHGLGAVLYHALIELCAAQGIKAVYGIVTSPTTPASACTKASASK